MRLPYQAVLIDNMVKMTSDTAYQVFIQKGGDGSQAVY